MKESELVGKLLPGHPEIRPIIENIREKYQIPEVRPEDDINEILLTRDDIDWDAVRNYIQAQVQNISFFDDPEAKYIQSVKDLQSMPLDLRELEGVPGATREAVQKIISAIAQSFTPMLAMIDDNTYRPVTKIIFEYLLTGKTINVPEEWFSKVFTMNMFGNNVVVAMAREVADPKEIAEQFKDEFTKTFGKDRPKITETHLSTAEYLAMKLEGKSLKYLVETYQERHPSEFPKNRSSKAYREAMNKHQDMMKKRIRRLKDVLGKMSGDET